MGLPSVRKAGGAPGSPLRAGRGGDRSTGRRRRCKSEGNPPSQCGTSRANRYYGAYVYLRFAVE